MCRRKNEFQENSNFPKRKIDYESNFGENQIFKYSSEKFVNRILQKLEKKPGSGFRKEPAEAEPAV